MHRPPFSHSDFKPATFDQIGRHLKQAVHKLLGVEMHDYVAPPYEPQIGDFVFYEFALHPDSIWRVVRLLPISSATDEIQLVYGPPEQLDRVSAPQEMMDTSGKVLAVRRFLRPVPPLMVIAIAARLPREW